MLFGSFYKSLWTADSSPPGIIVGLAPAPWNLWFQQWFWTSCRRS